MDIVKSLSEWRTWDGGDLANLSAIVTLIAFVVATLWSVFLYPRKRINKLENETRDNIQEMLRNQAGNVLKPLVERQVGVELASRYNNIAGMQAELARIDHDMGSARATIQGVRENRENLAQLWDRINQIEIVANEGARFARAIQAETVLTERRVEAQGEEWLKDAARIRALPAGSQKPQEERRLLNTLVDICAPIISNAVLHEVLTLTPAAPGTLVHAAYDEVVEAYVAKAGKQTLPKKQWDHAFRGRLTESCIKLLQEEMYSYQPPPGTPPDFYARVARICLTAMSMDIAALQRGQDLP